MITLNFSDYILCKNIFLRNRNLPLSVKQVISQMYSDGQFILDCLCSKGINLRFFNLIFIKAFLYTCSSRPLADVKWHSSTIFTNSVPIYLC